MMALSKVFYANVKRGFIKVEDITLPQVKKEVEELLRQEKEQSGGEYSPSKQEG